MKETFVQIGFSGLRAPDGSFLPSVPIYIKVPAETVNPETGEYTGEDKMIREFSSMCLPYVWSGVYQQGTTYPSLRRILGGIYICA